MCRVQGLIAFSQTRDRLSEFALLETVQAQTRLVKQQDGIGVGVRSFGEEHDKERNQPLKTTRPLVELDLDAKLVYHHDLEVLTVCYHAHRFGLGSIAVRIPDRADLAGQTATGGIELDASLI